VGERRRDEELEEEESEDWTGGELLPDFEGECAAGDVDLLTSSSNAILAKLSILIPKLSLKYTPEN
jgi:hypothetical protein